MIEISQTWRVYGAGLTLGGAALRAFDDLGILEQIRAQGAIFSGFALHTVDGKQRYQRDSRGLAPIDSGGGIMRPALHAILAEAARSAGVHVHLAMTVEKLSAADDSVSVLRSDGVQSDYDLVVAADGIGSRMRPMAFPASPSPQFTGQGCWRLLADRPPNLACTAMYIGGPHSVGFVPVSERQMYMFLVQNLDAKSRSLRVPTDAYPERLREIMQGYGGLAGAVRESLGANSQIVFRPLEAVMVPRPWHRGRVVLLGDSAHAAAPHLAMGAGMAVEDALILAIALREAHDVPAALLAYEERRVERCRAVVENSLEIGRLQRAGAPVEKSIGLMLATLSQLALPY